MYTHCDTVKERDRQTDGQRRTTAQAAQ